MGEQQEVAEQKTKRSEGFLVSEPWKLEVREWSKILSELPEVENGFSGQNQTASVLLSELSTGIKLLADKFRIKGLSKFVPPRLAIIYGPGSEDFVSIGYHKETNCVIIRADFLSNLSKIDTDENYAFSNVDGTVIHKGTSRQMMKLIGVEEAHHAIFESYKDRSVPFINPLGMSSKEYLSSDHEYRALLMKRRIANEEGYPLITLEHLDEEIQGASELRLKRLNK